MYLFWFFGVAAVGMCLLNRGLWSVYFVVSGGLVFFSFCFYGI